MPGARSANVLEPLPAAPAAVVVRTNGDGLSEPEVKLNAPKPSSVIFSTMIVPRARFVYVQSSTSAELSMANVTFLAAMTGDTPVLAEQSRLWKSQPAGRAPSSTV